VFVLVQDCIHSKEFYRDAHFVLLNYTCRMRGRQRVLLNDEAREFRWVMPHEALNLTLNHPTRILLEVVVGVKRERSRRKAPRTVANARRKRN
jgi:phosphoglycolate phosphatase